MKGPTRAAEGRRGAEKGREWWRFEENSARERSRASTVVKASRSTVSHVTSTSHFRAAASTPSSPSTSPAPFLRRLYDCRPGWEILYTAFAMESDPAATRAVGPYMLYELVDDLPLDNPETPEKKDATITCLEAWCRSCQTPSPSQWQLTGRR